MSSARRLVIDIGTNSILALLSKVSENDIDIILDKQKTVRLGEGLTETELLSAEAMERASKAIISFLDIDRYDDVLLLGTEALRAASNADEFLELIHKRTGERIIVISGEKEAYLTFRGALFKMPFSGDNVIVIDVGGGSSEISVGSRGEFSHSISVAIGASRLYEAVPDDNLESYSKKAEELIMDRIGGFNPGEIRSLIATGGTITSIAAIQAGLEKYDSTAIHGVDLGVEQIRSIASRFEGIDLEARKKVIASDPERADLILPGAGIFLAILGILGKDRLTVSTGGLRFGAALSPEIARN
ncbi:MAG: hypothetical protein V3W18_14590 [candidate division Zixibacteria bacterium]